MKKAMQEQINISLDEMGIPDFAKATVVANALSMLSQEIKLPVGPFDISHYPPELQELVIASAKALLKIAQTAMLSSFLAALIESAKNYEVFMAEKEAKNAVLM